MIKLLLQEILLQVSQLAQKQAQECAGSCGRATYLLLSSDLCHPCCLSKSKAWKAGSYRLQEDWWGVSFKHTEPMCGGMGGHRLLKRRVQEGHLPSTEVEEPTSGPACCVRSLVSKGTNTAVPPGDCWGPVPFRELCLSFH